MRLLRWAVQICCLIGHWRCMFTSLQLCLPVFPVASSTQHETIQLHHYPPLFCHLPWCVHLPTAPCISSKEALSFLSFYLLFQFRLFSNNHNRIDLESHYKVLYYSIQKWTEKFHLSSTREQWRGKLPLMEETGNSVAWAEQDNNKSHAGWLDQQTHTKPVDTCRKIFTAHI